MNEKRRVIICEGPERVGKSTQVKLLWKWLVNNSDLNLASLHYSGMPTKEKSSRNFYEMFEIVEEAEHTNFILDRSHLGEVVYASKYRGYDGHYVFNIEDSYDLSDFYLITFIDDPINIASREDGDSLSLGKLTNIEEEVEAFKQATLLSSIPHKLVIDISDKPIEKVHKVVIEFLTTN